MYRATVSGSDRGRRFRGRCGRRRCFLGGSWFRSRAGRRRKTSEARLGAYYPYGEDRTATANDVVKFASYVRDSISGLDYANQRYYGSASARFATPDPYQASGGPSDRGVGTDLLILEAIQSVGSIPRDERLRNP